MRPRPGARPLRPGDPKSCGTCSRGPPRTYLLRSRPKCRDRGCRLLCQPVAAPRLENHKYRWELHSYGLPDGYDRLVVSDIIELLIEALKGICVADKKLRDEPFGGDRMFHQMQQRRFKRRTMSR
jgi:hypothetical protein